MVEELTIKELRERKKTLGKKLNTGELVAAGVLKKVGSRFQIIDPSRIPPHAQVKWIHGEVGKPALVTFYRQHDR